MQHSGVIRRLYRYRRFSVLREFDLPIAGLTSALLIGKNGAKSQPQGTSFEILQQIARGKNRVRDLVAPADFPWERSLQVLRARTMRKKKPAFSTGNVPNETDRLFTLD